MTRAERERFEQLVMAQSARCRKPHFSSGPYPDRQRIEDWNNGVLSLAREMLAEIAKLPVSDPGPGS